MLAVGMLVGDEGGHADELIVSHLFIASMQTSRCVWRVKGAIAKLIESIQMRCRTVGDEVREGRYVR